jgi:hypothetical protein
MGESREAHARLAARFPCWIRRLPSGHFIWIRAPAWRAASVRCALRRRPSRSSASSQGNGAAWSARRSFSAWYGAGPWSAIPPSPLAYRSCGARCATRRSARATSRRSIAAATGSSASPKSKQRPRRRRRSCRDSPRPLGRSSSGASASWPSSGRRLMRYARERGRWSSSPASPASARPPSCAPSSRTRPCRRRCGSRGDNRRSTTGRARPTTRSSTRSRAPAARARAARSSRRWSATRRSGLRRCRRSFRRRACARWSAASPERPPSGCSASSPMRSRPRPPIPPSCYGWKTCIGPTRRPSTGSPLRLRGGPRSSRQRRRRSQSIRRFL